MKPFWLLSCLLLISCAANDSANVPAAAPSDSAAQPAVAADPEPVLHPVRVVPDLLFASPDGIDLLMDLHLPEGVENPPLVMTIHGGAWQNGNRKRFDLAWIAEHGYAVANIEYRMSREAIFPAQIHDCKGALRWLRAHQKDYGYNADKVVVAGLSAGGYLATLLGTTAGVAEFEGTTAGHVDQSSAVQGIIDYFGPVDFVERSKTQPRITDDPKGIVYQLLGGAVKENLEHAKFASPVNHVGKGDPPLLILHGDKDPQVLPAQSERLLQIYQANGLEAQLHMEPGKGHGWKNPTPKEEELVLAFLQKHLR